MPKKRSVLSRFLARSYQEDSLLIFEPQGRYLMLCELKRNTIALQAALLICLVLCLCGPSFAQDVKYNFMPGTDFSRFKTYKWIPIQSTVHPDQIVDQQIKQAVDSQLATKGLTKTESENADLYVGYQCAVNQEKQWDAYNMGGPWRFGGGMTQATSSTINVGTLAVDFYNPAAKQLVWRGTATKSLDPSKDPQKNQAKLNKAIAKLLKDFPPPPKK